jgi:hypothetical protein
MMVGEGMLQGGTVKVSMKKEELDFEIKKITKQKPAGETPKKAVRKSKEPVVV